MKIKFSIITWFVFLCPMCSLAQDVIVKKDGSTILSKVTDISSTEIKYKKFSNQQGPTYTISTADVLSINYENGDKDTFGGNSSTSVKEKSEENGGGFVVNPNLESDNLKIVQEFNKRDLIYTGKAKERANDFIAILGITEGSILETPEVKADFLMKRFVAPMNEMEPKLIELDEKTNYGFKRLLSEDMMLVVVLTNKTNRTIFVDQASCFVVYNEKRKGGVPFYIPTSTTKGSSNTSSGGVGYAALGMGIGVGASATSSSSTTTYSQRFISIPPKASVSLTPQNLGTSYRWDAFWGKRTMERNIILNCYMPFLLQQKLAEEKDKQYKMEFEKIKIGESVDLPILQNPPFSVHLVYSFEEDSKNIQSMRMDFFFRKLIGAGDEGNNDRIDLSEMDASQDPLIYLIRAKNIKK